MLHDLDSTIEALFKKDRPDLFAETKKSQQVAISFARPDQDFLKSSGVTLPAVDLFLYDVREYVDVRRNEVSVTVDKAAGKATEKPAPLRVNCSYLVTAWSKTNAMVDEHRLLGDVMTLLLRYREIPSDVLQGSLKKTEPHLRALGLREAQLSSLGEFWQAIGGKAKTALHYRITVTVDPYQAVDVPVVTKKVTKLKSETPEERIKRLRQA